MLGGDGGMNEAVTLLLGSDDDQTRSQALRCDLGATSEVLDQRMSEVDQARDVDGVRCRRVVVGKTGRSSAKQGDRTLDVAALDVGDADCELRQPLPEHALIVRPVLPCGLEHLVRVKCQPAVQQVLGIGEGFGRRQLKVIRDTWNAFTASGKRSAESVARAGASGSAGVIAITLGHVPIIASESHPLLQLPRGRTSLNNLVCQAVSKLAVNV
jgi:hypothetical protein